jgi:hypothetical protein
MLLFMPNQLNIYVDASPAPIAMQRKVGTPNLK